jgi:hypothetical protein
VRAYRGVLEVELGDASEQYRRRFVRCEHAEEALVLTALEASREALSHGGICDSSSCLDRAVIADRLAVAIP